MLSPQTEAVLLRSFRSYPTNHADLRLATAAMNLRWIFIAIVAGALYVLMFLPTTDLWMPIANTIAVLSLLAAALYKCRFWKAQAIPSVVCITLAYLTWTVVPVMWLLFVALSFAMWAGFGVGIVCLMYLLGRIMSPGNGRNNLVMPDLNRHLMLLVVAAVYIAADCIVGPLLMMVGVIVDQTPSRTWWFFLAIVPILLLLATTLFSFNRRELNRLSWFPILMAMLAVFGLYSWWELAKAFAI